MAWSAVVVFDLLMMAVPSIDVRSFDEIYPDGAIVKELTERCLVGDRVLDRDATQEDYGSPLGTGVPLCLIHRIEPVRGYNSFDIANYRRYLKRIAGDHTPLRPFDDAWTFPLVGDFPIEDQAYANLLGIRYLVAPTASSVPQGWRPTGILEQRPRGYDVVGGGVDAMAPYQLYENPNAFPKAWTVDCSLVAKESGHAFSLGAVMKQGVSAVNPVDIQRYSPNEIRLRVEMDQPGLLVLSDAWFPGWQCNVNGERTEICCVESLFRGVELSPGLQEVVFTFRPHSVLIGRWVTLATLLASLCVIGTLAFYRGIETADQRTCKPGSVLLSVQRPVMVTIIYLCTTIARRLNRDLPECR